MSLSSPMLDTERARPMQIERRPDLALAAVTHDLKQPLSRIRAQAQMMQRSLLRESFVPRESISQLAQEIVDATYEMNAQLDRLLDAAHPTDSHARIAHCAPTDLIGLVRTCAERVEQTTGGSEIRVDAQVEALVLSCDAVLLQAALSNLIDNAVKYSPAGQPVEIWVEVERTSDCLAALVEVRDSGVGIPAADMDHIFEPFMRGRNVAHVTQGSGVGLASAREAVRAHGGTLTVASQEGVGTSFTVRLPLCSARCTRHRR